jgi:zinc and cadmium transporter
MLIYFYSIISVIVVSLIALVGIFLLIWEEKIIKKYIFLLVSLAVGALLGDAFIHLLPEAFKNTDNTVHVSVTIIFGILVFFLLEKFLHWHHHKLEKHTAEEMAIHPTGRMILISDSVHNFIDGLIIGASYMLSIEIGIATTIAIILHEIPQEIGHFGVLINAGYKPKRALWLNFLSAVVAIIGTIVALLIGNSNALLSAWLVPFASGGLIYIAMSDLIPELHKTNQLKHSILQFLTVILGICLMLLLILLD